MSDLNNVNLIGRLVRDADIRYLNDGRPVGNFTIAVGKQWKDQNGQKQERTVFVDITQFGRIVESIKQYLVKGQQVRISGELKQDNWEKDGQKHSKIGVNASEIQLLGGSHNNSTGGNNQQNYGNSQGNIAQQQQNFAQSQQSSETFQEDVPWNDNPNGIPF